MPLAMRLGSSDIGQCRPSCINAHSFLQLFFGWGGVGLALITRIKNSKKETHDCTTHHVVAVTCVIVSKVKSTPDSAFRVGADVNFLACLDSTQMHACTNVVAAGAVCLLLCLSVNLPGLLPCGWCMTTDYQAMRADE